MLLLFSILLILLIIPNTSADGPIGEGENDGLDEYNIEDPPTRPTVLPDLTLTSTDITFSNEKPKEKDTITIEATIHNQGWIGALVYIEFYDGNINRDNLIGSEFSFVNLKDEKVISINWVATYGRHQIRVMIRDSTPRETIIWNNVASKTIVVTKSEATEDSGSDGGHSGDDPGNNPINLPSILSDNPTVSVGVIGGFSLLLFVLANKHYYWVGSMGAIPLYSRITNGKVLDQSTRKEIYEYIDSNPGTHFSSIMKDLKLKNGVTSYHLAMLEREGFITSKHTGLYRRFSLNGVSTKDLPQTKIRKEIVKTISDNPGISQTDIASSLGVSNQVVNYHIGILRKENSIKLMREGYKTKCFINAI
jgi:DNA-binding MarR family transcriptional regulator